MITRFEDTDPFFSMSLDMLCIAGFDGYFKRLNPAWERTLGASLEELQAEPFLSFVHPDDKEATIAAAASLSRGDEIICFQNRYRCKDGTYRSVEWTAASSMERQLMYCVGRDVTERVRAQAQLNHLLSSSPVILYSGASEITGAGGRSHAITLVSENITAQLGYQEGEILGKPRFFADRIHPDDARRVLSGLDSACTSLKERFGDEYRFRHKDGSYRWLRDDRKLMPDKTRGSIEFVGSWQDVTERRQTDELIRKQSEALMELSTPLIPLSRDVLVMPLVGTLDTTRVRIIIDTLLNGISKSRARMAILDITGVSVVDTQVANALITAAKSVQLLGSEVVLTGIRPEVAQTLVGLGADLSSIVTRGTLEAGIQYAMRGGGIGGRLDRSRETP